MADAETKCQEIKVDSARDLVLTKKIVDGAHIQKHDVVKNRILLHGQWNQYIYIYIYIKSRFSTRHETC